MSVYVDELTASERKINSCFGWPYQRACHMYADTLDELHEMAGLIGIAQRYFHPGKQFPHYDLTAWKRQQAIARGAVAADRQHAVAFRARQKEANP
jgi:hypothetical protein